MATLVKGKNLNKPYTVRYWVDSRQREKSFRTRREATDFMAKTEHDTRAGTFVDPKLATVSFTEYAATVIAGMDVAPGTRKAYSGLLNTWLAPFADGRSLAKVSQDRDGVAKLVNETMRHLSFNRRGSAITVILATMKEAVISGKLQSHRLDGIPVLKDNEVTDDRKAFVFPSHSQVKALADGLNGYGIVVWLMRGCGLRIREALAVRKSDFIDGGSVLRITGQASVNGDKKVVMKHRDANATREIPVPSYLWNMVKDMPEGPLAPNPNSRHVNNNPYMPYSIVYKRFVKVASELGIPEGFTPHSLRHAFATSLLTRNVPIHVVSDYLGHSDVAVTSKVYAHVLPSSHVQARNVLDNEYREWAVGGDTL